MSAAVISAGMLLSMMVVVVALYVGIKSKRTAEQCFDCGIRRATNTAVKLDSCLCQCHLCATADAAANKCVNAERGKKSCKCSVTATVGIHYFAAYNFSVLCVINLKLFGMAEVLKDLSVFVSYCNFYCTVSFAFSIVKDFNAFLNCTVKRIAVKVTAITSATGSAVYTPIVLSAISLGIM